MEWMNASPLTRQKKLEDIVADSMADTFFTLHAPSQADPVYVSEVADKATNPNFRFFDLGPCGPGVTRLDSITVKVWAKSGTMSAWQYLLDYTVHLTSLQFIGKTLGRFRHPLPQNCILFHMTDGIYTSFLDMPAQERTYQQVLAAPRQPMDGRVLTSSSYDALMRLSTLDDCIQDALITRDRIADEIEGILEANKDSLSAIQQVPETEQALKTIQVAVDTERRRVLAARRRRDDLQASISSRRDKMIAGREQQAQAEINLPSQQAKCAEIRAAIEQTSEAITGQRRRVCEDLIRLFPVEPVPSTTFTFSIRSLPLPNSTFDSGASPATAAALAYVAQVVSLLSPYLSVLLPYPITLSGSTSTITDPLAVAPASQNNNYSRTYPLYMHGVVRYRFEYAVFLLNKDVEMLSNALGLRPVDIRHTLPNLKYLLYVATAGMGEAPARRTGGIKGLLRGGRKGSVGSAGTGSSMASERENGVPKGANEDGAAKMVSAAAGSLKQNAGLGVQGSRLRPVG
jgi:hypothetical protein